MSDIPPTDPRSSDLARKKLMLSIICGALIFGAIIILVLPVEIPTPLRLGLAFSDLVAASAIWLIGRQKFSR